MSSRDRGAFGAVARVGVILAIIAVSASAYGQSSHDRHHHGRAAQPESGAAPVVPAKSPEPYQPATPCDHPKSSEQENLCIEWRAADAAAEQAYWTQATFWIGLVGTGAVLATLFATASAARAAARAADIAERSLYTMERPWLFIALKNELPYLPISGEGLQITQPTAVFQWRNFGRSPGVMKHGKYRMLFSEELPGTPGYSTDDSRRGEQVVPSDMASVEEDWKLLSQPEEADRVKIETSELSLFFFGEMTYEDVHGREHVTGFGVQWLRRERFWTEAGGQAYNYRT